MIGVSRAQGPRRARLALQLLPLYIVVLAAAAAFIVPLYWSVIWSTWNNIGIFAFPPRFLPGSEFLSNLSGLNQDFSVARALLNSVVIALADTVGALFFCSLAGFAFAKYQFRGRTALFYLLLSTLAVPSQVLLIPLFIIMQHIDWVNTFQGLIVPSLVPALGVFFMRQNIQSTIPDELLDAGRLDGAGEFTLVIRVVLPVLLPSLAALSILLFTLGWGSLFWPLVMARTPDMFTLPVGLATVIGQYKQPYGEVMVGSLITILPPLIVFLGLQRYFVSGLISGSLR